MPTVSLLYKSEIPINDKIKVRIPTVGEILDNEDEYYDLITLLTAMPIDMLAQLDDAGIDFSEINEYDLFIMLFGSIKEKDTSLIFGDLRLCDFYLAKNEKNDTFILLNPMTGAVIDRVIHSQIADALRMIHGLKKDVRRPANDEAKKYLIEKAKRRMRRMNKKKRRSQIEELIVSMVNVGEFHYNYQTVRDLTIYQFNESVRQIIKKDNYDHTMVGIYMGTVNPKTINQDSLNWLSNK